MSYKPDEATLISFVMGELDAQETERVMAYLDTRPEALKEAQQLADTRKILALVHDKEVIAPPIFLEGTQTLRPLWQSTAFRTALGIAASFMLILVAGKLLGPEIQYSKGELTIRFGKSLPQEPLKSDQPLTAQQVKEMIDASLHQNNEAMAAHWSADQERINQSIRQNLSTNSRKIDGLVLQASQASQEQVKQFVAGMQSDNLKLMKDYLQLSATDQKKYIESLLTDFSSYLQEQRKQDFSLFQSRMSSIEKNTDQFKQETEQILASMIANPTGLTKRINNY